MEFLKRLFGNLIRTEIRKEMKGWNVDLSKLPGPDRKKWSVGDILVPSPDNSLAAMIYSYSEFSIGKMVGLLALLKAPPEKPQVIFRPPEMQCFVWFNENSIQWLDHTTCVVTVCSLNKGFVGRMYINTSERSVGFEKGVLSGEQVNQVPAGLMWYTWEWVELNWAEAKYTL